VPIHKWQLDRNRMRARRWLLPVHWKSTKFLSKPPRNGIAAFNMISPDAIVCRNCKHYFVSWDKHSPHGCRAIGFKSRQLPSRLVHKISGSTCLRYTPKVCPSKK
jgi:hypothetical protein